MNLSAPTTVKDNRSECYSVMGTSTVKEYMDFIAAVYNNRGAIAGQRDALKNSSAIKIRKRMVQDIARGTVLPPIVVGLLVSDDEFEEISEQYSRNGVIAPEYVDSLLAKGSIDNISLIDGMQRTTAIKEALETTPEINNNILRVEIWIVKKINNLLYRMLILNTGQVPWNVRRQLEVLYAPIQNRIMESMPDASIFSVDDQRRRAGSTQYQGDDVIELFMAFGSRKEKVEVKERIAEEFTRLDFIETSEKNDLLILFIDCFKILCQLDEILGSAKQQDIAHQDTDGKRFKFSSGSDLFNSQPARIGLIVALSQKIIGRPGIDKAASVQEACLSDIKNKFNNFLIELKRKKSEELHEFLSLDVLNELLSKPSSKVGDFERSFFKEAFLALIEQDFEVPSFDSCWRAY
ncbi:MAG: hypothetical protein J6C81_01840 [Muribaculaceae bacterium]|nr:hypothetical protein [Muribaculaceae bacterium]